MVLIFGDQVGPRTFFPLPFNEPFCMSPGDLKLMWDSGALILRYPGLDSQSGFPSYMFLVTKEDYGLSDMNGKSRNQTRRGIENCTVRQIPFDYLLHHGQLLISDTLRRQDRVMSVKVGQFWQKFFTSAAVCPALGSLRSFRSRSISCVFGGDVYRKLCSHSYGIFSLGVSEILSDQRTHLCFCPGGNPKTEHFLRFLWHAFN